MSSNNKKDPPMEPFHPKDERTTDTTGTTSSSYKDGKGQPKEDPDDKPSTAPADRVAMDRSELERQKAAEMRDRSRDVLAWTRDSNASDQSDSHWSADDEVVSVDSSSDDNSLTPGAMHVGGVINTLDSTRTFSESNIVDEPPQLVADRAMATVPSVPHLVAELVPETDNDKDEIKVLQELLRQEREERTNTVVVVASSAEPMVEGTNFIKRKTMIYCGIAAFVIIGVVVGVVVSVTANNNMPDAPTPSPATSQPSKSPSPTNSRFNLFLEALLVQEPGLEVSVLTNPSTPQWEALSWLVFEDTSNMDPETAPGRDILERFVLATFYFATNGDNWKDKFNFLQETSVCAWNNGATIQDNSFRGIQCNGSGQVSALTLSKLVLLFHVIDNTWNGNSLLSLSLLLTLSYRAVV
jgi:hypothetical protein